jgi:hypothetical protein
MGYGNPVIKWTIPAINDIILVKMNQIQIAYNVPIECSSQNISIYQKVDDGVNEILRETYSGKSNSCNVLSDNYTLSLSVLSSTFNQPNAMYYVYIDPNFVEHNTTLEPLLGISKYKWIFSTGIYFKLIHDTFSIYEYID